MTKLTYHLKSGKSFVSNDGKADMKASARDVAEFLSQPGNVQGVGQTDHVRMLPASSVDYVEMER